jgi:quinol monooxygenase YgiN
MSEAVRVVVKIVARSDAVEQIRSIVLVLAEKSRKESGCVSYDVVQDMSQPENFVLIEEWASVSALDAHNRTPHFHEAVTKSAPLLAKPLDVGRYVAIG